MVFVVFTPANTHFAVVERSGLQAEAVAETPNMSLPCATATSALPWDFTHSLGSP